MALSEDCKHTFSNSLNLITNIFSKLNPQCSAS